MKKNMNKVVYLGAIVLLALTGCKKETPITAATCGAGGFDADYQRGRTEAGTANQAEYDRGYLNGQALTYNDGLAVGKQVAYNAGYNDVNFGYPKGYNQQYPIGYTNGFNNTVAFPNGQNAGMAQGQTNGTNDGRNDGEDDGYYDGFDQGYIDGYDDGYDDGYWAGGIYAYDHPETCPGYTGGLAGRSSAAKTDPNINPTSCYMKGYNEVIALATKYNTGYADGKLRNNQYQSGVTDGTNDVVTRDQGRADGFNAGKVKGYDDGYAKGYQDKYNQGFNSTYTSYYNYYYNLAYNNSYNQWWYYGYDEGYYGDYEGYDDGWDVGYDDGFDDQCWLMGFKTAGKLASGETNVSTSKTGHMYKASSLFNEVKEFSITLPHSRTRADRTRKIVISASGAKSSSYAKSAVTSGTTGGKPARGNQACALIDGQNKCSTLSRNTMDFKAGSLKLDAANPLTSKGYKAGETASVNAMRTARGKEAMVRSIGRTLNKGHRIDKASTIKMLSRTTNYKPIH